MDTCRLSFRYPIDLPVAFFEDNAGGTRLGQMGRALDLSRSGISICLPTPAEAKPEAGKRVCITVFDRFGEHPILRQWTGRIIHVNTLPNQQDLRLGIAFDWPEGHRDKSDERSFESSERDGSLVEASVTQSRGVTGYRHILADRYTPCVALVGFAIDQGTKHWANEAVSGLNNSIELISNALIVTPVRNPGALASIAASLPITGPICTLVSLAVLGFSFSPKESRGKRSAAIGILGAGLLAAGLLGNAADRLALGYVRDFLVTALMPRLIFNIADVFILVGGLFWLAAQLNVPRTRATT